MPTKIEARLLDNQMVILSVLERLLALTPEMEINIWDGHQQFQFAKEQHQEAIRRALTASFNLLPLIAIEETKTSND